MAENNQTPTIRVGRDFKFGDISGQVAIGNNNLQYRDCTFLLPDGSTVEGKSWRYTQGMRPTTDPKNIFGRKQELDEIDELMVKHTSLVIAGVRGTGKSTIASLYVDRMEKRKKYAGIFWRRIDETTDISDVVGSFFEVIGKPIKDLNGSYKIEDQLALLFRELEKLPYFLVLDNFETLISPKENKPLKTGFSEFIEKTKQINGESRVLFTSWECPVSEGGIRPKKYQVKGLDQKSAIQLLRKNSLDEPESKLIQAIMRSGGHPKALILLCQLVTEGAKTLSQILENDSLWKGEVAENLLDEVYDERLADEERKLLQYTSVYREAIPLKAIIAVADHPNWSKDFNYVEKLMTNVTRKSLLNKTGDNYWAESLIQTYAYSKIAEKFSKHKLACDYYLLLSIPDTLMKKEDAHSIIEAHYHACMAREYDKAANIIFSIELDKKLSMWGNYDKLIELCLELLPKENPLEGKPLLSRMDNQARTLGNLGNSYVSLGDYGKATEYYRQALAIAKQMGDKQNQGIWLGNIGNSYVSLGDYGKATEYYRQALAIAKQMGDKQNQGIWLGKLGNVYINFADYERAGEYYKQALDVANQIYDKKEYKDRNGKFVAHENLKDVLEDSEYLWVRGISKPTQEKRYRGAWLGNLGNAYFALGDYPKAIEYYTCVLEIAKRTNEEQGKIKRVWNLGNSNNYLFDYSKAIEYYKQALNYVKKIKDKRYEAAWLNEIGNFFGSVEKKNREAIACLLLAKRIRSKVGSTQEIAITDYNLKRLQKELGDTEFNRLRIEIMPIAESILKKTMGMASAVS